MLSIPGRHRPPGAQQFIDEGANFRLKMAARRIHRADRWTIDGKMIKNWHQSPGAGILTDQKGRRPRDAQSRQRGICRTGFHEDVAGPIVTPATPHVFTAAILPQILGHEFSAEVVEVEGRHTRGAGRSGFDTAAGDADERLL